MKSPQQYTISTKRTLLMCILAVLLLSLGAVIPPFLTKATPHTTTSVPLVMPTPVAGAATAQVAITLGPTSRTDNLQLSTNLQSAPDILPLTSPRAKVAWQLLQQWQPPLVRVHLGFRADDAGLLPETTQGNWDFTQLDAIFTQLRAHHISYFFDVRTAPPWMYDNTGHLPESNFSLFADYMARLVGWYNKGGFTDENGHFHASGHYGWIHTWEIWNEPKSSGDIPVPLANRQAPVWMPADQYALLYDTTVTAMHQVDATLAIGGLALNSYPDDSYIYTFIADEHAPLAFLSFHFYAGTEPTEPDAQVLSEINGPRFLDRLQHIHQWLTQFDPQQSIPIWVDEVGINENSRLPIDPRGTAPIGYAFIAGTFITAIQQDVRLLCQFPMESDAQLGLMDNHTLQIYRTYWLYLQLAREFPPGSLLLPVQVPASTGLVALAALSPDQHALRVLVANMQVAKATDIGGAGVAHNITLDLAGTLAGHSIATQKSATLWSFDARTPATTMPPAVQVPLAAAAVQGHVFTRTYLAGYGAVILDIPLP